ncbi:MAG: hypothetical protein ETSY1_25795 [Candidatus Entotheonella factor]|uniref:Uncharacterized protein n=1 Tax=Entotheonella factor TaxID=1429438 RepID=W4LH38_ENTF1|nr:MAG: hypothetical protein ETSY1_25795 [Candidatus Entotheonella factor]
MKWIDISRGAVTSCHHQATREGADGLPTLDQAIPERHVEVP